MNVRGGHQYDASTEQMLKKPAKNHGIADIRHEKLIETQDSRTLSNPGCHFLQWILVMLDARQIGVHLLQKAMKVRPELLFKRQAFKERVHDISLATADTTVKINPFESFIGARPPPQQATHYSLETPWPGL